MKLKNLLEILHVSSSFEIIIKSQCGYIYSKDIVQNNLDFYNKEISEVVVRNNIINVYILP